MCGIVGYIGDKDVTTLLLEGLKRLEYRGYDSAGVAVLKNNSLLISKEEGKIARLEKNIPETMQKARMGIAHTRWATHGEPSQKNAHPHLDTSRKIAVVHNGIIENFSHLKKKLQGEGFTFSSDTDSEVLPNLISKYYDGNLEKAVQKALLDIEGTYGILVICEDEPDTIVTARNGSPVVLGIGETDMFIASDTSAIVAYTRNVIYLEDHEMAVVKADHYKTMHISARETTKEIHEIDWDIGKIEKNGYEHFMLKEIFEQPETIENAFRGRILLEEGISKLGGFQLSVEGLHNIKRILIIACGTSYYSGLVGEYIVEDIAGIPVEVEYASEFRYRNPIIEDSTMVLVISQSGETADTLAALREARRKGAKVYGITNVVGSTIARETDGGIYIHAGPEIGVASTKAFTSQVVALILITLAIGRRHHLSQEKAQEIIKELKGLPQKIQSVLNQSDKIQKLAEKFYDYNHALYLGRGYNYPVALEGALKLKEISYIHAEGYPAAEMKHGPIALIDENMPVIVIATASNILEKVISNIQEVKARKGQVIAIATEGNESLAEYCDEVIYVPKVLEVVSPIVNVIPLQLFAYYIAVLRGCSVDQPRNLAKSVTVE
ncbi:MAG: glutamine--fructose-6-phosphate transaminase (isomerizing) [Spirochaetota bacterium]